MLQNQSSPQYQSLTWLADEDPANLDFDSDVSVSVLLERYVMKLFHHVTSPPFLGWTDELNFLSADSVCEWRVDGTLLGREGAFQGVTCHEGWDDPSIRTLRIGKDPAHNKEQNKVAFRFCYPPRFLIVDVRFLSFYNALTRTYKYNREK